MNVYEGDKLVALSEFLSIAVSDIHVWSDNSLTIGSEDQVEYYVTKGKRKHDEFIGRQSGYNIYKRN